MPLVRGCRVALSLENMTEMTSTVRTHNLDPLHAKCAVGVSGDGSRESVKERRPAATRLELVLRLVQRCVASGTCVHSLGGQVLVVLSGEWGFGALSSEDTELLWMRKLAVIWRVEDCRLCLPGLSWACHSSLLFSRG